jgi:hypothetical protein
MVSARHEGPTLSEISPAFKNGLLIRRAPLLVQEIRLVPEMSITIDTGDSDGEEGARGARDTVATRLVTHESNVSPTPNLTCFTHVYDHMIVYSTSS